MGIVCKNCGFNNNGGNICSCCGESLRYEKTTETTKKTVANSFSMDLDKYKEFVNNEALYKIAMAKKAMATTAEDMKYVKSLFEQLAYNGYNEGMYQYGLLLLNESSENKNEAIKWFIIAAENGHNPSKIKLQIMNVNSQTIQKEIDALLNKDKIQVKTSSKGSSQDSGEDTDFALQNIVKVLTLDSAGTGFLLGDYIITNIHVIASCPTNIFIRFDPTVDTMEYTAIPIAVNPDADIAVLQFTSPIVREKMAKKEHFALRLGEVKFGEFCYTIGNSMGLGLRYSAGHIGNPNMPSGYMGIKTAIGIDLDIMHGNSGGPLLDANNRVIGITTYSCSGSDYDKSRFAIKAQHIYDVINLLD